MYLISKEILKGTGQSCMNETVKIPYSLLLNTVVQELFTLHYVSTEFNVANLILKVYEIPAAINHPCEKIIPAEGSSFLLYL